MNPLINLLVSEEKRVSSDCSKNQSGFKKLKSETIFHGNLSLPSILCSLDLLESERGAVMDFPKIEIIFRQRLFEFLWAVYYIDFFRQVQEEDYDREKTSKTGKSLYFEKDYKTAWKKISPRLKLKLLVHHLDLAQQKNRME